MGYVLANTCIFHNSRLSIIFFVGISLVDEKSVQVNKESSAISTSGVRRAYTIPKNDSEEEQTVPEATGLSLEELMAEMKAI